MVRCPCSKPGQDNPGNLARCGRISRSETLQGFMDEDIGEDTEHYY
jgi:hypothetical protein